MCIKQSLTVIGGGGGVAGVFALAAVQHSTFLCDIQRCDLRKPALQNRALSFANFILSLQLLSTLHVCTSIFFLFQPFVFKLKDSLTQLLLVNIPSQTEIP